MHTTFIRLCVFLILIFFFVNKFMEIETSFDTCFLKAQNANAVGDSTVAQDASRTAKILNIVGLVCGIILIIIVAAVRATQQQ